MQNSIKAKTTSLMVLIVSVFLLSALAGVGKVSAVTYTEYTGTLGDAAFAVRIPDSWNGGLVVICRPYSATVPSAVSLLGYVSSMLNQGFAIAASNYGAAGFCVQNGMNATYQLTQYVRSTFNATGKIYIEGVSLGGDIALMLGEKYPNVYSGVLDMCGAKNLTALYNLFNFMATANDTEMDAQLQALTAPIPPYPFSAYGSSWRQTYRAWCSQVAAEMVTEFGGTPNTVPQAYRNSDPIYNANISIPVIAVHGTSDAIVPYSYTLDYKTAVTAAGKASLYRLYPVAGGEHVSTSVIADAGNRLNELIAWSNALTHSLTLTPAIQKPGASVTVQGVGFGSEKAVAIGFGAEVQVINEWMNITGPFDVGNGPYTGFTTRLPVKPATFRISINMSSTTWFQTASDVAGNGTLNNGLPTGNVTLNYVTGNWTRYTTSPVASSPYYKHICNYTAYEYNVTPAAGVTTNSSGAFTASITVPAVANGVYAITAVDTEGHIATAMLTVDNIIPEGLTIGVMLLLSTVAVIASTRYFRKRPKTENFSQVKL